MRESFRLTSIKIEGFRPFGKFEAKLGPLEVIVGANGAGKSSLFEFLRFLRDSMEQKIPAEIIRGTLGRSIFHSPGPERFRWCMSFRDDATDVLSYTGEVVGPVGRHSVQNETVITPAGRGLLGPLDVDFEVDGEGVRHRSLPSPDRLTLGSLSGFDAGTPIGALARSIAAWVFYSSSAIQDPPLRRPAIVEQTPTLREDASNLSAVLHYLLTEHRTAFDELQAHLRSIVPGFENLTVKARGAPGEVIAFWKEEGVRDELTLGDLSDGILRLLCWLVICLHPAPPPLICIDEPDQGVHPRTLPVLAGLFEKASERTQILLATHSSFFLTQFPLSRIAVLRKENGEAKFLKPADSAVLSSALDDFGPEEIEVLHRSDELERYA